MNWFCFEDVGVFSLTKSFMSFRRDRRTWLFWNYHQLDGRAQRGTTSGEDADTAHCNGHNSL